MAQLEDLLALVGLIEDNLSFSHPSLEQNFNNYLENGERILSLARKKKKRGVSKSMDLTVRLSDFKYPNLNFSFQKAIIQIENTIKKEIRDKLQNAKTEEYLNQIGIPFLLQFCPKTSALNISVANVSYESSLAETVTNSQFILKVRLNDIDYYVPTSPKKRFSDNEYYFKRNKSRTIHIFHADKLFYQLFIVRWLHELKSISKFDDTIKNMLRSIISQTTSAFLQYDWDVVGLPNWMSRYLSDNHYELSTNNYYIRTTHSSTQRKLVKFQNIFELQNERFLLIFFFYDENDFSLTKALCTYDILPTFYVPQVIIQFALKALHFFVSNIQDTEIEDKHRKKLEGLVARAYTTKRNIPDYILHEMRTSELNDYFGFIEFDEDVDLDLVFSVIEEFKKLNHHIFHDYTNKDIALRFRKLGRHHATGLYYPSISTMVVDFRYPSSFIHEYFHMLDDELGNLSHKYDFSKIVTRYQYLLKKEIEEDKQTQKQIHLSGKYNLNYYLRKCEIFARCGEIHLFRNLRVISSLLKPEETHYFCYPDDKELNSLINDYYSHILNNLADNDMKGKGIDHEENLRIADH